MVAPTIDPHAWADTIGFLRNYDLQRRPEIASLLALIDPAHPTPATVYRWRDLQAITARFREFHETYAQIVAPHETLDQHSFSLCTRQLADGQHVTVPEERVTQHIGIYAQSGAGKTTLGHHIAMHAYARQLDVISIDGKSDAPHLAITYPRTLIVAPTTPIAPLDEVPGLSRNETSALLERILKRVWWAGVGTEQIAHESLKRTYDKWDHPSIRNWCAETLALHERSETYQRRDRIDGLAARLTSLIDYFPGIGCTPAGSGINLEELCTRPLYFGYTVPGPAVDLLANWLFELRLAYNRAHGIRQLNTLGIIDESHLFLHDETIGRTAAFGATFPLLREFGIGILLTATNDDLPSIVLANIATTIVMNLSDARVARDLAHSIGIKDHHELLNIPRGECIIKTPEWPHAIRAAFEPLVIEKHVDADAWTTALARTFSLVRTAAVDVESEQPLPVTLATLRLTPAALPKSKIALNAHAEAILTDAATHGVVTTIACFARGAIHPQAGMRGKKQLLDLALIEEERITVRKGRGGRAVAIRPTKAGYERAGIKRRGTRGGDSIQHEYLVRQLAVFDVN